MGEMELSFDWLKLNRVVDIWDTGSWKDDLDNKTTLQVYRNKAGIG